MLAYIALLALCALLGLLSLGSKKFWDPNSFYKKADLSRENYTFSMKIKKSPESADFEIFLVSPKFHQSCDVTKIVMSQKGT